MVQISLGDLAEPASFRHALRGVRTVVHLAAAIRDQPRASIEELNALATLRLLRAAEQSGVERFILFSALGSELHSPARFMRSKALAERAVEPSTLRVDVLAPSLVYSPGDRWLRLLERMSYLPLMPLPGEGRAVHQPIFAGDVADCVTALLDAGGESRRIELAGPDILSHEEMVALAVRSFGRTRRRVTLPMPLLRPGLRAAERLLGPAAPTTADEVELLQVPMTAAQGTAGAESLGVRPRSMWDVLGA